VTTSTIPTAAKENRSSWVIVTVRRSGAQWDRPVGNPVPSHHQAGKAVIDWAGLYMGVVRVGDAAEDSRFSLRDQASRLVVVLG
jgi:hypothetical protein